MVVKVNKKKNIEIAVKEVEKEFGEGAIIRMNQKPMEIDVIPTSSIGLNDALGVGGIPVGRSIEIFGKEAVGKTTLATNIMINALKTYPDKDVAVIDAEHAFDVGYGESQGLDLMNVWISQPSCAEEAYSIIDRFVASQGFSVIVVDSTAALVPQAEIEGSFNDTQIGALARVIGKGFRKLTASCNKSDTTIVYISQMRSKIQSFGFGPKEDSTGGNAIKFFSSVRIHLKRVKTLKKTSSNALRGLEVEAHIIKNKLAPPHKVAEYTIYDYVGICEQKEVLRLSIDKGLSKKEGTMYHIGDVILRGEDQAVSHLIENKEEFNNLKNLVLA